MRFSLQCFGLWGDSVWCRVDLWGQNSSGYEFFILRTSLFFTYVRRFHKFYFTGSGRRLYCTEKYYSSSIRKSKAHFIATFLLLNAAVASIMWVTSGAHLLSSSIPFYLCYIFKPTEFSWNQPIKLVAQ